MILFTAVYIAEWLVLQTIYVLKKGNSSFFGLKSMVHNQEWFQIKSGYNGVLKVDDYIFCS